jgi:2-polyprenyl-6-methoxyphenol hydroxylase-like FAD-dependent oxidoreductase
MSAVQIQTTCCIVGGGPAGMMLGLLLARSGVDVVVLEKHADFLRDFRGDTVHPSTLQNLHELGILEEFLKLPHQELQRAKLVIDDQEYAGPDFSYLSTKCRFIALMPQWDFLNFLAKQGQKYRGFQLLMSTAATDLIEQEARVIGVRATGPEGELEVRADLVVAADGRHSRIREQARLPVNDFGVPIDVLWFHIGKHGDSPPHTLGRIKQGKMLVTLDRGDYFQCGFIIRKGSFADIQARGLETFRRDLTEIAPYLRPTDKELQDWSQVKLLTVQINRLPKWHRPGLLCVGDAAHAMSPAGGVGINFAIQDAVATANLLGDKLRSHSLADGDLSLVQRRREWPVRVTQWFQVMVHRRMFGPDSQPGTLFRPSWPLRLLLAVIRPLFPRLGAWGIGMGVRPEHVQTKEAGGALAAQ